MYINLNNYKIYNFICIAFFLCWSLQTAAKAQTGEITGYDNAAETLIPKPTSSVDHNGVDLATGQFSWASPGVSVGLPSHGGLSFRRTYQSTRFRPGVFGTRWGFNLSGYISVVKQGDGHEIAFTVVTPDGHFWFDYEGGGLEPVENTGANLTKVSENNQNYFLLTDKYANQYYFNEKLNNHAGQAHTVPVGANIAAIERIVYADGREINYRYSHIKHEGVNYWRPNFIESNSGARIYLEYHEDANPRKIDWFSIKKSAAINANVDSSCAPDTSSEHPEPVLCPNIEESWPTERYNGHFYALKSIEASTGEIVRFSYIPGYHDTVEERAELSQCFDANGDKAESLVDWDEQCFDRAYELYAIKWPESTSNNIYILTTNRLATIDLVTREEKEVRHPLSTRPFYGNHIDGIVRGYSGTEPPFLTDLWRDQAPQIWEALKSQGWHYNRRRLTGSTTSGAPGRFAETEVFAPNEQHPFRTVLVNSFYRTLSDEFQYHWEYDYDLKHGRGDDVKLAWRVVKETSATGHSSVYEYEDGLIKKITFPKGNAIRYSYSSNGNVEQVEQINSTQLITLDVTADYPECDEENKLYCNKPRTVTDELGNVTRYLYDPIHGGIRSVIHPEVNGAQPEIRFFYSKEINGTDIGIFNQTATVRCQNSNFSSSFPTQLLGSAANDLNNSAHSCIHGSEDKVINSIGYGSLGNEFNLPIEQTVTNGDYSLTATTRLKYDDFGNIIEIDGPLANDSVHYFYDRARRKLGEIGPDPDGSGQRKRRATRTTFHPYGGVQLIESGVSDGHSITDLQNISLLQRSENFYDPVTGLLIASITSDSEQTTAATVVTEFSHTPRQQIECTAIRRSDGVTSPTNTGACNHHDPDIPNRMYDRISKVEYDDDGRQKHIISALGTPLEQVTRAYSFTPNGLTESVTDANGNVTTYSYDGYDRLGTISYPDKENTGSSSSTDTEIFIYDEKSNIRFNILRDNNEDASFISAIEYRYDALGRVKERILPDGEPSTHYCYDNFGRIVDAGTGATCTDGLYQRNKYDALGRMVEQKTSIESPSGPEEYVISYGHDLTGKRTNLTYPDGFCVSYKYDFAGNIDQISENGYSCPTEFSTLFADYDYDEFGRVNQVILGNATETTYQYDGLSRLTRLSHLGLGSDSVSINIHNYNKFGQILDRTITNSDYSWYVPVNSDESYEANGLNQYTDVSGYALSYDGRGNLENDGVRTFTFDGLNRLVSSNTNTVQLTYDPNDRLHSVDASISRKLLYDGNSLIAEYEGTTLLRRYIHGIGVDQPIVCINEDGSCVPEGDGTRFWILGDERGSIIAYANELGHVVQKNTYDVFGVGNPDNGGVFQYTGQQYLPELDLFHYKSRIYHPHLGRFMQTDPIGYKDQMNLYTYVRNDPLNFKDPSGLYPDGVGNFYPSPPDIREANRLTMELGLAAGEKDFVMLMSGSRHDNMGDWMLGMAGELTAGCFEGACGGAGSAFRSSASGAQAARSSFSGFFNTIRVPGSARSRINVSKDGFSHVIDAHFNPLRAKNKSQFTISQNELRSLLSAKDTINSPVRALQTGNFARTVHTNRFVGNLAKKYGGGRTKTFTVITDGKGNLQTAFPSQF